MDSLMHIEPFRRLFALCPDPAIIVDKDRKVLAVNDAFLDYLPNGQELDCTKMTVEDLCRITNVDSENTALVQALGGVDISKDQPTILNSPSLVANAFPIRNSQGETIGAMGVYHNVQTVLCAQREDRLNLIGEMAAGVAHEIRNPMTVAKGYLQLLQKKSNDPMVKDCASIIVSELDRANSIITSFLSIAKNKMIDRRPLDLNEVIESMYNLIYSNAVSYGIQVKLNLSPINVKVLFDEQEFKQLLLNLVQNAIDELRTGHGTEIVITTTLIDSCVIFSVANNGPAIPAGNLDKIFDPFYTTKDNGTGLGLSICVGIVRRHSGTISAKSDNDETVFIVTLPSIE